MPPLRRLLPLLPLLLLGACALGPAPDDLDFQALLTPIPGRVLRDGDGLRIDSPALLRDAAHHVWGASVARGEDGRYHMYYARFDARRWPFSDSWLMSSVIAHAVSAHPDRGFVAQGVVLPGRAALGEPAAWDAQGTHNPHVQVLDGRTYLYYIGARDPGPQPAGSPGAGLRARDRIQQLQQTGVVVAASPEALAAGDFRRPDAPLLGPRTRVKPDAVIDPSAPGTPAKPDNLVVVNPSLVPDAAGAGYLLYFKGNLYDPGWRGVHGVARGATPEGPFVALDRHVFDVRDADGRIASAEDPYVWHDPRRRRYYALVKDFSGRLTGAGPGLALLTSRDGLAWQPARHPLAAPKSLHFADGTILPVEHLERPQLLLDEDGQPQVLYLACRVGDGYAGPAFNVQVALRRESAGEPESGRPQR